MTRVPPNAEATPGEATSVFVGRLFFFVLVVFVLVVFFVVLLRGVVGLAGLFVFRRDLGVRLQINPDFPELGLEELEQLVDVVPAPLVEDVGQKLEEICRIEAALDLFDLLFGECLEDVFTQGLGVPFLDRFLGREPNLLNGTSVEVEFHVLCAPMIVSAFKRSVAGTSRPVLATDVIRWNARAVRVAAVAVAVVALLAPAARAQEGPPRASEHYFQYGTAFATETVASAGGLCPANASDNPCILGSGVGLVLRAGYRARGPFFIGGAYEFSRQDSSNLLRLAVLQQLRAEARYYLVEGTRVSPYFTMGTGGVLYGNEWGAETGGLMASLGAGVELEISRTSLVGAAVAYRPMLFRHWEDSAGQVRADNLFGFGLAHIVGIELVFEVRDPLSRW